MEKSRYVFTLMLTYKLFLSVVLCEWAAGAHFRSGSSCKIIKSIRKSCTGISKIDKVLGFLNTSKTCVIFPEDEISVISPITTCLTKPECFQGAHLAFTWLFSSTDHSVWSWGHNGAATCYLSDSAGNKLDKDSICQTAGNKVIVHDPHTSKTYDLCQSSRFATTFLEYRFHKACKYAGSYTLQITRKNLERIEGLVLHCVADLLEEADPISRIVMPSSTGESLYFTVPQGTYGLRSITWILEQPNDSDSSIRPGQDAARDPTTLNAVCKLSGFSDRSDLCSSGDIILTGAVYPDPINGTPIMSTNTSWCSESISLLAPLILPYTQDKLQLVYVMSSTGNARISMECKTFPAIQECDKVIVNIDGTLPDKARHVPFYFPLCNWPDFLPLHNPIQCSHQAGFSTYYGKGPVHYPSGALLPRGFCGNEMYDGDIYTNTLNIFNTGSFPNGVCKPYLAGRIEIHLYLLNEDDDHEWIMNHTVIIRKFYHGPKLQLFYGRYRPFA